MRTKLLDLDACPTPISLRQFCGATDKPKPAWFWGTNQETVAVILRPNHQTRAAGFEAQTRKPSTTLVWGSTKKPTIGFEAKSGETVATSFEVKLEKTVTAGFEAKPPETVAASFEAKPLETVITGFEAKPVKTVRVVLRTNHSQTIDLGFDAQLWNPRF
jgi:hypothetical protein